MTSHIQHIIFRFRLPIILTLNLVLTSVAYVIALGLRFDFDVTSMLETNNTGLPLALLLVFRSGAYMFFGLNNGYWRYSSTTDLLNILKAHIVSAVFFTAAILMFRVPGFPRSVIVIELALSILFSGGLRLLVRLARERYSNARLTSPNKNNRDVIVLGAGDSGHLLIKNLLSHRKLPYTPAAVLDDSERLQETYVHGIKVLGPLSSLPALLQQMPDVGAVIVAIPSLSLSLFNRIETICQQMSVAVKRLQAFEDIACLDASVPHEPLSIESVLEKETRVAHENEIRLELRNKRILITGAGGSIGSEIVRQVIKFGPEQIILLDNSEFNLFQIERELREHSNGFSSEIVLANISDSNRLVGIFNKYKPEIVFHAAAYKHVPLMEVNCYEAFKNNVIGTRNLLEISYEFQVQRFVMISTDKAVDPSSIMGCSKRIAEMLIGSYGNNSVSQITKTAVVRFGNVINSAGSVIPLFKEQISRGGPITVTHPDMTRYFMSIREAVRLVLTAGTLGENGDIYILEMGKPIRIVDVAKKMRALYGRRDIPIIFTGLRPGEKLTETLTCSHEITEKTQFQKIQCVTSSSNLNGEVKSWVMETNRKLHTLEDVTIGEFMREFVANMQESSQAGARVAVNT